jgi:protein-S-isoprenylcysteine O-methyltransferase Ste14
MIKEPFYLLLIICIVTHVIRTIYEILKHTKSLIPNQFSFIIMFINMVLLWVSWFLLCKNDIYKTDLPFVALCLGIIISGLGLIAFLTALFTIKTLESYDGDLLTSGIYSKIRHPMYLGFIFWLIGFPLIFGSVFSMILSLFLICNILFWRFLEEKELLERFPTYQEYKKKTIF